ncbi:MAG: 16S rRNA (adenine(1518)-N(6)/adenine(1519)-N(6))-dimethyltransferase RsmA [Candidatus Goldiibacteriota bacterium]|jgi:16S rRNA (adenine1518-N6/adenine1519-N6)-dimethyltransferase
MTDKKFYYKKGLGQNFLHNTSKLGQMASLIDPQKGEAIIEIGPGAGALTQRLLPSAGKVIAVEIDNEAISKLRGKIGSPENLQIINADFMELDLAAIVPDPAARIKVVGNIPYYITTPIIEKLILNKKMVSKVFLTVQREVGERMAAPEGSKIYGSLSIFCQYHAQVKMLLKIDRSSFFPVPDVDSAFVMMDFEKAPELGVLDEELFFKITRAGFNQRRKMLANNVKRVTGLDAAAVKEGFAAAGIDEKARAEEAPLLAFAKLSNVLYNYIHK